MERVFNMYINTILLFGLWCILNNKISYNEELALSLIYIVLFIIISEKSRDMLRVLMINQTLKLMSCYEYIMYLKIKIIVKNLKLLEVLSQKNNINIINFELKEKKKNYLDNKKKINKIEKMYYLFYLLLNKIHK